MGLWAAMAILGGVLTSCDRGVSPPPPGPLVRAEDLQSTDILPHMDGPIVPGRNYVYCGSFQLAWNELQDEILKGPVLLEGDPPMATALNGQVFRSSDLSEESYLAMVGEVSEGIVERIRTAMAARFPQAGVDVPDAEADEVFYAFAYLEKVLTFREPFERVTEPLAFHGAAGEATVACFGIAFSRPGSYDRRRAILQQVTVLSYRNDDDFVLRLLTTSEDDELLLAKISPQATLAAAVQAVRERIRWQETPRPPLERGVSYDDAPADYPGGRPAYVADRVRELREQGYLFGAAIERDEPLKIPLVVLNAVREYSEVANRGLLNPGWEAYYLKAATQGVRFRLNEYGAVLKSWARVTVTGGQRIAPRRFVFDKPFLLCLTQKGAKAPYFALWVESAEVLEKR